MKFGNLPLEVGEPHPPLSRGILSAKLPLELVEKSQHNLGISSSQIDNLVFGGRNGGDGDGKNDEDLHNEECFSTMGEQ